MRLNNDCIRDVLLYIEDNTDYKKRFINIDKLLTDLDYDENTLFYHISMISQANLVDKVVYADNKPISTSSLSWNGHQYLDNIRDDKVWSMVKDKTKNLASVSLNVLIPLASKLLENMLFN